MSDDLLKQFSLKKPCKNCPFIATADTIELMPGRRHQIISDLITGQSTSFHCHKTVYRTDKRNHDEDGNYVPNDVCHCPGAMAVTQKCGHNPTVLQIAERFGVISPRHYDEAMDSTITPEDIARDGGVMVDQLKDPWSSR